MVKTSIGLDEKTKALIAEQGKFGETYDKIIQWLLAELKERRDGKKPGPI